MDIIDRDLEKGLKLLKDEKQVNKAIDLINKSAIEGITKGKSYFEIGMIFKDALLGGEPQIAESKQYFDIALKHFFQNTCDALDNRMIGDIYNFGYSNEGVNKSKALEYYKKSAEAGDDQALLKAKELRAETLTPTIAQPLLQEREESENVSSDTLNDVIASNEVKPLKDLVETDNTVINSVLSSEQVLLRVLRVLDNPVSSKNEKLDAIDLAKSIADKSVRAANLVAYLYETDNELVNEDLDLAKEYYEKAIANNSATAYYRLGILYTIGHASFFDLHTGHELIKKAGHLGDPWALCYIGDRFRLKVDSTRNLDTAYRYYALAGERGLGLAYHYMAEIDASRAQLELAESHEKLAFQNGFNLKKSIQDPVFYILNF